MSAGLKTSASSAASPYAAATAPYSSPTATYAPATAAAYATSTPSYSHGTGYNSKAYAAAVSPGKVYSGFNHDYNIPSASVPSDSTAAAAFVSSTASAVATFPTPTVVRSPSVKPATAPLVSSRHGAAEPVNRHVAAESGNRHATAAESGSTPRPSGQRCLPETPRAGPTATTAPIYANLEAGNSRNAAQVSRLLEEGARLRNENVGSGSGNPPAIPRPAARLSLRQKVLHETTSIG